MSVMGFILFDNFPNRLTCCLSHDPLRDMFPLGTFSLPYPLTPTHTYMGVKNGHTEPG